MEIAAIILIIIVALLLVLVVLAQNSKGGGISSSVGLSNQVMGVQRSTESVEKITWILVSTLAVLCVLSTMVFSTKPAQTGTVKSGFNPKTQFDVPVSPQQDPSTQPQNTTMPGTNTQPQNQ